ELDGEQQAALEKIMAEINGDDADAATQELEATPAAKGQSPSETLDDEQQAAPDKMVSEINTDDGDDAPEPEATPTAEGQNSPDELDDEQQAALDKIMAEINGDDAESATQKPEATQTAKGQAPSETLDDEQQAAPDKMVAEINTDDGDDAPEPKATPTAEGQNSPDELDDEQQAALDKIMAEINGDDAESKTQEPEATPPADAQIPSDALDDEQQAALDKIMAEISGDDGQPAEEGSEGEPGATTEPAAESGAATPTGDNPAEDGSQGEGQESEKTKLSLEEFNDELTNLLSNADSLNDKTDSKKAPEKPAPDSVEKVETPTDPCPPTGEKCETNESPETGNQNDHCILQEVTGTENPPPKQSRQKRPRKARAAKPTKRKRIFQYSLAALLLIGICTAAYWRFGLPPTNSASPPLLSEVPQTAPPASTEDDNAPLSDTATRKPVAADASVAPKNPQPDDGPIPSTFISLREKITSTREHVMLKIEEIKQLQAYYQSGVNQSREKIIASTATVNPNTLKSALKNRQTELEIRAIQRRMVYMDKLETPIRQLSSSSEELLYLERKTRLYETLQQGVTGLSIDEFEKEAIQIVDEHSKSSNKLSIDHIDAAAPSLESIWADIQSMAAVKTGGKNKVDTKQDKTIQQEICMGNYDRKFLLTTLGPESAECLSKWPGKGLYLNGLTKLPPPVAKSLSQWPGEWLSLNGLTELPAESAKYLSQWKGKRLSLNGLTQLTRKATRQLSKWQGEQLEMVGLKTIGRWENYGTRLYLSEDLSRKLQIQ
ncbi:MAG: hypothetical protein PVJ19_15985, partial [Desulfobacteraceae bacterium]